MLSWQFMMAPLLVLGGWWWHRTNISLCGDPLSPFGLLYYCWVLPFGASFLSLSDFQTGMVEEALALAYLCTAILAIISAAALYQVRDVPARTALTSFGDQTFGSPEARAIVLAFYGVTMMAVVLAEFSGQGVPILEYLAAQVDQHALHRYGKESRLQVLGQAYVIAGMMAFFIALTAERSRVRWTFGLLAALVPMLGVLKASKVDVLFPALYYGMLAFYWYRWKGLKLPMRRIAGGLAVLFIIFTVITTTRISGVVSENPITYSDMIAFHPVTHIAWLDDALAIAYGYTALSFQNFSNFVAYSPESSNWGISLLRPFYSVLMRGDVPDAALQQINWYYVASAATVGTYLRDLYAEGGATFCILGTVVYALFVNLLYVRFRRVGSALSMFIYVSFAFAWTWLFFQNAFSVLGFYINAGYTIGICLVVARARTIRFGPKTMPARFERGVRHQ